MWGRGSIPGLSRDARSTHTPSPCLVTPGAGGNAEGPVQTHRPRQSVGGQGLTSEARELPGAKQWWPRCWHRRGEPTWPVLYPHRGSYRPLLPTHPGVALTGLRTSAPKRRPPPCPDGDAEAQGERIEPVPATVQVLGSFRSPVPAPPVPDTQAFTSLGKPSIRAKKRERSKSPKTLCPHPMALPLPAISRPSLRTDGDTDQGS